ncbi:MAG TPA: ThiF family adenylyltransferase [Pirellulales bacterium]|jgi:molybdopterin/thiamine biosynthesis adenylyltransferase|nr:ThiF family adenylyltransferase [Pirellulales bacterium]
MSDQSLPADLDRYARQMRYAPLGEQGQQRLANSRALVCGCGALGSVIANTLVRAGVGHVRLVDRDFLELNNLQRQVLYNEADVASGLPKAIAAANRLRSINSQVTIEPIVTDIDPANVIGLTEDVDVILDGTDNFETRMLLNDVALSRGIPWVYGGCLGAEGQTMTILPGETACLRCLMHDTPPPGSMPTCDTAGILAPIINIIASLEANEAIKILSGHGEATSRELTIIDIWDNRIRQMNLDALRAEGDCPACRGEYNWLNGDRASHTAVLCGRNAVQLNPPSGMTVSLAALAEKLSSVGRVTRNPYLIRATIDPYVLTVFPDGRAIVGGTDDIPTARTVYAKYVGI